MSWKKYNKSLSQLSGAAATNHVTPKKENSVMCCDTPSRTAGCFRLTGTTLKNNIKSYIFLLPTGLTPHPIMQCTQHILS